MKKKLIVTCVVLLGGASGLVAAAERSSAPSYDFVVVEERCGLRPEAGRGPRADVRCFVDVRDWRCASVRVISDRAGTGITARAIDQIMAQVRFPS